MTDGTVALGGVIEVRPGQAFVPAPAKPDPSQCRFCRWWQNAYITVDDRPAHIPSTYAQGECHRRSPKSVKNPGYGSRKTVWPQIEGKDWCGDFERFRNADGTPNAETHA